jgi:hypothetical protein
LRRAATLGQSKSFLVFTFFLQVIQDLPDHHRVFAAGNDFHGAAAFPASLDVDIE